MIGYIIRRLGAIVPTLLVGIFIAFALTYFGPGDPIQVFLEQQGRLSEDAYEALRRQYGLDRPFLVQFGDYVTGLVRGTFGRSIWAGGRPIEVMIRRALPVSVQLGFVAFIITIGTGIPLGIIAALRQNTLFDYAIVSASVVLSSIPTFVLAPMLLILFVLVIPVLKNPIGWGGIFDARIVLPAFCIAVGPLMGIVRQARSAVLEVIRQDYVRTAYAKGLPRRMVIWRHIFRHILTPLLSVGVGLFGGILQGSIFVERVFNIPGYGALSFQSFVARDFPVILATTVVAAIIAMSLNLVLDISYGLVDPRVRLGRRVEEA